MRGGKIFIEGDVGYRCGIHMKAYLNHRPAIVIGGRAGSFWANTRRAAPSSFWAGIRTASHRRELLRHGDARGEILLRCDTLDAALPAQVKAERIEGPAARKRSPSSKSGAPALKG